MAKDTLINGLTGGLFDSNSLIPAMTIDGTSLKTTKVTADDIANYALGKIDPSAGLVFAKDTESGKWKLSHNIDTTLYKVVTELPTEDIDPNKIYVMVANDDKDKDEAGNPKNVYIELIYINKEEEDGSTVGNWEIVGKHKADTDLSGYYTKEEVDDAHDKLQGNIDTITNKANNFIDATYPNDKTTLESKITSLKEDILGKDTTDENDQTVHTPGALEEVKADLENKVNALNEKLYGKDVEAEGEENPELQNGDINDIKANIGRIDLALNNLVGDGEGSVADQIDTKVNALEEKILGNDKEGDDAVIGELNKVKNELKGLIDALDAKLKEYDERFGYTHTEADGTVWKKAFLMIADETQPTEQPSEETPDTPEQNPEPTEE